MTIGLAHEYFSKLLNVNIDENTVIKLSSAQRSRAHAWFSNNNLDGSLLSSGGGFTLKQIANGRRSLAVENGPSRDRMPIGGLNKSSRGSEDSVGIDIQNVSELFPGGLSVDPKADAELLAIFTVRELSYAQAKPNPLLTLTGIFAAKEAVIKCLQGKTGLTDIEVLPDETGAPSVPGLLVSISHSRDYAVAIALNKAIAHQENVRLGNEQHNSPSAPLVERVDTKRWRGLVLGSVVCVLVVLEVLRLLKLVH